MAQRIALSNLSLFGFILLSFQTKAIEAVNRPELAELQQVKKFKFIKEIDFPFTAYHPQGILKLNGYFFLSTVDKQNKRGYVIRFRLDKDKIVEHKVVDLTEGAEFHPGGIDFDPKSGKIVTAVAQYATKTTATLLRIDPETLQVERVGKIQDHIGCVFVENMGERLHWLNWDAVDSYRTDSALLSPEFGEKSLSVSPIRKVSDKALQDFKFLGKNGRYGIAASLRPEGLLKQGYLAIYEANENGGLKEIDAIRVPRVRSNGTTAFDLEFQAKPLTQNPVDLERTVDEQGKVTIHFYFAPYDDEGTRQNARLLVYGGAQ